MSACPVNGCCANSDVPYNGRPLCQLSWCADPAIWRAAHIGCLAMAIPPTSVAAPPLTQEEMLAKWRAALVAARDAWRLDSSTRDIWELAALAFGEAIQRHFMGGDAAITRLDKARDVWATTEW